MPPEYRRDFTPNHLNLILPNGPLHPLITGFQGLINGEPYAIDVQFGRGNKLMWYRGAACVLVATLTPNSITFDLTPAERYGALNRNLMQHWAFPGDDPQEVLQLVSQHLLGIMPLVRGDHYANPGCEGYFQNRLVHRFTRALEPHNLFIIDRECVLDFTATPDEKNPYYGVIHDPYAVMQGPLPPGREADNLALDAEGHLVVMELKKGDCSPAHFRNAPLQVMLFHDAIAGVLPHISNSLKQLVLQKIQVGLLPPAVGDLLPEGDQSFLMGTPRVVIGTPPPPHAARWGQLHHTIAQMRQNMGRPFPVNCMTLTLIPNNGMLVAEQAL